ncbi:MAG TPA: hypothetical protein VM689_15185 [Aliidongia sp.]|nr:hypothetical protein [Aliidongia sp.]
MTETDPFARPPDSEAALLRQLDRLVESGRITLAIDRTKLGHIDFPLGLEADANRWIYPMVAATAAIWWLFGLWAGLGAAAAMIPAYLTLGRAYMARRLDRRIREQGLKQVELWRRIWRFGGVVLMTEDGASCQGPAGNWMALVRSETVE